MDPVLTFRSKLVLWVEAQGTDITDFSFPSIRRNKDGSIEIRSWKDDTLTEPSKATVDAISATEQELADAKIRLDNEQKAEANQDAVIYKVLFRLYRKTFPLETPAQAKRQLKTWIKQSL